MSLPRATRSLAAAVLCCLALGGCATGKATLTDPERDPWEGYNRKIHAFNQGFDKALFRPVAKGYDFIMPDAPQRGVRNFFRNLGYPVTLLNSLAQGNFDRAHTATERFLMNSTIGLAGFLRRRHQGGHSLLRRRFWPDAGGLGLARQPLPGHAHDRALHGP